MCKKQKTQKFANLFSFISNLFKVNCGLKFYYYNVNKEVAKSILKETVFCLIQFVFSKINIAFHVNPVGLPFAMTRLFLGHNLFLVTISYFLSKCFLFNSLNCVFVAVYEVVVISLYYFAKEFVKTKKQTFMLVLFVMLSAMLKLYFSFSSFSNLIYFLIEFILKIFAVLFFVKFYKLYKSKFLFFKFSNIDYLFFSIYVLLLALGFFSYGFIQKHLGLFVLAELILISCRIFPAEKFFVVSSVFAIGASLASGVEVYLAFAIACSLVLVNFKELNKYFYAAVALIGFSLMVVVFKFYTFFSYFSLFFAVFCYLFIPARFIQKCEALFENASLDLICYELQNSKMNVVKNKLNLMANTLTSMQKSLKFLIVGKISREKASEELSQDVVLSCCKNCENYKTCFSQNINKKMMIENLLLKAIENKQVFKDDLSNGIQSYCMKSGILVNEINQTAKMFLSFENAMKHEDTSKLLISNELENFSNIFLNFAKLMKNRLKINKNTSKIVKEACLNAMIDSKEVVVLENEYGVESVNLVVENQNALKVELKNAVEKIVKNKVKVKEVKHLKISGLALVSFVPEGRFKLEFAVSTKAKESKNGDNFVVSKIDDNRYFLAIADGMGHGEQANKISEMVLSLIKSMFEIGLDDELVLQSVNKLLLPVGLDNFTTLDACVIDLEKEVCNFIKLGASISVLKHKNSSEIISCESLPIGIVKNIKPTIIKKSLNGGDMIFLASDGVVDSFHSIDSFNSFVNDSKIYNLQKFLDTVIADAEFQNTKHPDDMTIMAINLLKN